MISRRHFSHSGMLLHSVARKGRLLHEGRSTHRGEGTRETGPAVQGNHDTAVARHAPFPLLRQLCAHGDPSVHHAIGLFLISSLSSWSQQRKQREQTQPGWWPARARLVPRAERARQTCHRTVRRERAEWKRHSSTRCTCLAHRGQCGGGSCLPLSFTPAKPPPKHHEYS
jgi:hypothetical protein